MSHSIFASQHIYNAIKEGYIKAEIAIPSSHIQPASLDLRLGAKAWRVAASFLPNGKNVTVLDKIKSLQMYEMNLDEKAIFERGCVYIVELEERIYLPNDVFARANPKSSTGRLDIFARVLTDKGECFDDIPRGFEGKLYAEISPRTFSVRVSRGDRLTQLRFMKEDIESVPNEFRKLPFTVDVLGESASDYEKKLAGGFPPIVGWRARKHAGLIDLSLIKHYSVFDYWEPVFARKSGGIILDPDDFYILATAESIEIPYDFAAEMLPYDTAFGEFRVHYAGFFDPGFGISEAGGAGAKGVLEVRTHEVPFLIDAGQNVGHLNFEPMLAVPEKIYGKSLGSNYQGQGLMLAKQFATL